MAVSSTSGDQRQTGKSLRTVLIATERDLEQNLLAQALDGRGFAIVRSHDGLHALELARANPPDLMIASVSLPMLDGFSLFKRCQQDDQLKQVPVILYSSRSNDQKSERFAQEVGATHFVSNGLKAEVIQSAVDAILKTEVPAAESKPAGAQVISIEVRQLREQGNKLQTELQQSQTRVQTLQSQLQEAQLEAQNLRGQQAAPSQPGYLFDQNPVAMWLVNKLTNGMLAVNDAALKLFGYDRNEFLALDHEALLRSHAVTPTTTTILSFQHRDGRALSLVLNSRDVDFEGKSAELVAAHDVTYRVRGERAIVDEAQRVKSLLSAMPLPYWVIDHAGKLVDANEHFTRLTGYRRDELIGTHLTSLLAEGSSADDDGADKPAQQVSLKHKDGSQSSAFLILNPAAANEHTRVILVQPRNDDTVQLHTIATEGSLQLKTVLEIMRYAADADESTLLQFSIAQLASTFSSPLALFASVNPASQTFNVLAFTYVQSGKRIAIATNEPIALPAEFRDALSKGNAVVRDDASVITLLSSPALSLGRHMLCPSSQGDDQWFLLVANRDATYSDVDQHQLQSCADILVTLLTLKRRQAQTQGLQHQAQSEATSLLGVLQRLLSQHDAFATNSGTRVAALTAAIAKEMGLDSDRCSKLSTAAQLHDIGHLLIPQSILLRPTALEPGEQALMRTHVDRGVQLLDGLELGIDVITAISQHHERLDGSGYPKRLRADEIKLDARILAVADVVEAMCSPRAYRPARGVEAALEELKSGSGKLYDPPVVTACAKVFKDSNSEWPK